MENSRSEETKTTTEAALEYEIAELQKPYVVRNQQGCCVDMIRFATEQLELFRAWLKASRRLKELRKAAGCTA